MIQGFFEHFAAGGFSTTITLMVMVVCVVFLFIFLMILTGIMSMHGNA